MCNCWCRILGRIDIVLPDHIEKQLREMVFQRKGMKRGNLKEAITEAVILWLESTTNLKSGE
jgi:hypothetical protein